jgi:hypothetical protein
MRRETPDILGSLMGGTVRQEPQASVEQESNKASEQASGKAIKPESNKAIKQASKTEPKQTHFEGMEPPGEGQESLAIRKEKATFNLSKEVLGDLEEIWIQIRKLRGDKRISKTDIVEQAVADAIKEFKIKRELSKFYSKLESNKESKQ